MEEVKLLCKECKDEYLLVTPVMTEGGVPTYAIEPHVCVVPGMKGQQLQARMEEEARKIAEDFGLFTRGDTQAQKTAIINKVISRMPPMTPMVENESLKDLGAVEDNDRYPTDGVPNNIAHLYQSPLDELLDIVNLTKLITLNITHVHPHDLVLLKSPEPPILCATFKSAQDHGFIVWVDFDIACRGAAEPDHNGWTTYFQEMLAYCELQGADWVKLDIDSGEIVDELKTFPEEE
jgi:hypothetical protein